MYIINKLDNQTKEVISIGQKDKSVWDAKGLAVCYIRHFITENDGNKNLETAFNFDITSIKPEETLTRHFFKLNEDNGTFEVYKVINNPTYSYVWGYTNRPEVELIFSLSISKLDKELFKSSVIPFTESDLTVANNTDVKKDEILANASLVSELKFFIKAHVPQVNTSQDEADQILEQKESSQ